MGSSPTGLGLLAARSTKAIERHHSRYMIGTSTAIPAASMVISLTSL